MCTFKIFRGVKNTRTRIRGGIKSFMFFSPLKMNLLLLWSKKRCDLRISTSNFKRLLIVRENGNGVNRLISWVGVKSDIGNLCEIKRFTHRKKHKSVGWIFKPSLEKKDEAFKWTVNVSRLIKVLWLSCQNLSYNNHASWEKWYSTVFSLLNMLGG